MGPYPHAHKSDDANETILLTGCRQFNKEGLRGMDLAEEDWEGHEEGANEISPGGTFSYVALALPPGRTTSSAS